MVDASRQGETGVSSLGTAARSAVLRGLRRLGYDVHRVAPHQSDPWVSLGIDTSYVEILEDTAFRASVEEVRPLTLLDVPRLANLWALCRMTNPAGAILEVGSYRGGGALHLSNSDPHRRIVVCDSFQGFRALDPELDRAFSADMFLDTSRDAVEALFASRQRPAQVVAGYFPTSCSDIRIAPVSFVHLDVDTYEATGAALEYLPAHMTERSIIVSDDYNRHADGVNRAIQEFVARDSDWAAVPIFPSQALLLHRSWFS